MEKKVLGHIDCPTCGYPKGMRVTLDKNGEPFGFSEACCGQQLRIGGNAMRVNLFRKRHPGLFAVTDTGPKESPEPEKAPVTVTVTEPEPAPAKRRATFADALKVLGA